MLITKKILVKWNSKTKKYYESLGYEYTKIGEEFEIDYKDLPNYSKIKISVQCDYCGKTILVIKSHREKGLQTTRKDACKDCKHLKAKDTVKEKYGVEHLMEVEEFRNKRLQTNIEKYGVDNVFKLSETQEKCRATMISKYGEDNPMKIDKFINKAIETNLLKYGETSHMKTEYYRQQFSGENSPVWKGGVKHHRQERSTGKYIKWRTDVYIRDKYTCQCCKIKGGKLNAHHLQNWKDNLSLRYDLNNGVTICEKCHIEFHKLYGKRHNNKSQYIEFLRIKRMPNLQ